MFTLEEEQVAFEKQLDEFLKQHPGQYALVKEGHAIGFYPDSETAYAAAVEKYGPDAIFFIGKVQRSRPVSISYAWDAGVMFGQ